MSGKSAKLRVVKDNRSVANAFRAAAGFMRGISIKRFCPKPRRRECYVMDRPGFSFNSLRNPP